MPRKPGKVPSYCHHRASGRAVVRIDGKDLYLGAYGSPESHEEYERLIAEWRVRRAEAARAGGATAAAVDDRLTINALILAYLKFAKGYYFKDGKPTQELADMKYALRPLRKLYGRTLVRDFGPLALKAVREYMITEEDLSRGVTNSRVNRIKRVFRWAVSEELAPPGAYEALRTVAGLRYGRTAAREAEPIKPVPKAWVDETLPFMSRQVVAMVKLQQLTAMRPGEVVIMRACDIDMTGDVWLYRPHDHKNRWRDHERVVPIGPKAQSIIKPFLKLSTNAYLFSPAEAEAERNAQRRQTRQTKVTPSQAARRAKSNPRRAKRDRYDRDSYRRAITYAIRTANREREKQAKARDEEFHPLPQWCPLQLRHSSATEIRKRFGIEAAQVALGHARADVTQIYAEKNLGQAVEVARVIG
jgi:integrase